MPVVLAKRKRKPKLMFGPNSNGLILSPEEFDQADGDHWYQYELINRVVVVSPLPARPEKDANEQLSHALRNHQEGNPLGNAMDCTLPGYVASGDNRLLADRLVWTGLGRLPKRFEVPSIVVDFVSKRMCHRRRDYEFRRNKCEEIDVQEYWIIDRFEKTMTVHHRVEGKFKKKIIRATQTYRTPLLPAFELPLARLLEVANRWQDEEA